MTSKISWNVRGYSFSISNRDPTTSDNTYIAPYIWINSVTEVAYILSGISTWTVRPPDYILNEGTDYQINIVERDVTETQSTGAPVDLGYLQGSATGDIIVWNAVTNRWEIQAGATSGLATLSTPNDGEAHFTPKVSSTGARGTAFFSSDDDHIYVGTGV